MEPPRDLTIPEPGSTTARRVVGGALKACATELLRLASAADLPGGPSRAVVEALFSELRRVRREDPGALLAWVRDPTLGTHVRCLRSRLARGAADAIAGSWMAELCAGLALRLWASSHLDRVLVVGPLPSRIVSLGLRRVVEVPEGARALEVGPEGARFHLEGGAHRPLSLEEAPSPFHPIEGDLLLAEVDNNPISDFEAHPEKAGNAVDLGGHPPAEWCASLAGALRRIETYLPELRAEIDLTVRQFVPVGYHPERHLSASYQEALGTVYLTLHPDPMTMTEAVVHEFSHNKLNALLEQDPLLHNAFHPLFTSPVRPDPRPLHGILLAVHAFQPVARLYERMIDAGAPESERPEFQARYRAIRRGNHEGVTVLLENAKPTAAGRALLEEMRRWDAHFSATVASKEGYVVPSVTPARPGDGEG